MKAFEELVQIVARLRGENGCPWDLEQTPESFRPYIIEEAYEVVDAIDRRDRPELKKELGDVLFQIVMLARMAEEAGWFDLGDVVAGINKKMIDRHPHVFDPTFDRSQDFQGIEAWERRKALERAGQGSALDGVPEALPALLRAHRVSEKASMVGFDWPDVQGVRAKVTEELAELDEALEQQDDDAVAEELGDLMLAMVNLGRHLPTGAEDALRGATRKFEARFRRVEAALAAEGRSIHAVDADELEEIWRTTARIGEDA
ncbi:MAG: nucleoside triphosphate pyrophosphohydrolase [Myxococcales bacterium]|nr:nucleoside triphosphate pyrophosphohydrolase [Myxococcales bacterium]